MAEVADFRPGRYPQAMAPEPGKPKVVISSSQNAMRVPRKKLTRLIAFVARQERAAIAEVDLAVVGSDEMASLNRRFLGRPQPTDVLSFDLSNAGDEAISVQLIVCGDMAVQYCRAHGIGPQRELMLYVVHGLLHLLGYEDKTAGGSARMHSRQEEILNAFLNRLRIA